MAAVRRVGAMLFAGDRRVWRVAGVCAIPFVLFVCIYCVVPRDYETGTNSVEVYTYVAQTPAGAAVCVPGLELPPHTARLQFQLLSGTSERPALHLALNVGGQSFTSDLKPMAVGAARASLAIFAIPARAASSRSAASSPSSSSGPVLSSRSAASAPSSSSPSVVSSAASSPAVATACLTADGLVNWGGTPLVAAPTQQPPTLGGVPIAARIAVTYLPRAGSQRSYVSRAGAIFDHASLFRAGVVGPWLYWLLLLVVLPVLALAALRCLAVAAAGHGMRRLGLWLYGIAVLNFICWALITPSFQAPDEVDHFAYTQSLVERGLAPSQDPGSPLPRWSSAENVALEDMSFFTDHQVGDTKVPWESRQQSLYRAEVRRLHPRGSDGGGNETAATHGPVYYGALAPAYLLASSSPFDQLTLMRITSALIGALTVLFTFLLARELAPGRPWLAVLAALLVAYEPMYGFISGAVNNDVGVNAGAAALELLLIRAMRRGITLPWGLLTGGVMLALPFVKGTSYSLFPVAAIALGIAVWRHHRRTQVIGWAGFAVAAIAVHEIASHVTTSVRTAVTPGVPGAATGAATGAVGVALEHPLGYLAYLWEVFLPRLSFMTPHFDTAGIPAFSIFVERGWGAFGWYDVFFPHWIYDVILVAMLAIPLLGVVAARRERVFVRGKALEVAILLLFPIAVVAGFEAAFYTTGVRPLIGEFGRYAFPAIGPLAVLVVASLHAFGRRRALFAGTGLLVSMLALGYAAQLVTLTGFYA